MTLIPEDVLNEHLNKFVDALHAIPGVGEVDMTQLQSGEGWAAFTVICVLPKQDPTGKWVTP